jgi:hypothetical protein
MKPQLYYIQQGDICHLASLKGSLPEGQFAGMVVRRGWTICVSEGGGRRGTGWMLTECGRGPACPSIITPKPSQQTAPPPLPHPPAPQHALV